MGKEEKKIEYVEKKFLNYKNERYEVMGAFSHPQRAYISIDVKDENGNPYVICDSNDVYYGKIEKVKVEKELQCLKDYFKL